MSSRLASIARASRTSAEARFRAGIAAGGSGDEPEVCDLCSGPVPTVHRHVLDLSTREPLCVCQACALLFDREAAGGGHYRLIGDRRLLLEGFRLDDAIWEELRIPVEMAFFIHDSGAGRVKAYYPSPMGRTESLLDLAAWGEIAAANPILANLEPDVEALLVNRAGGAREHWLVPVDDCYALVALIRTRWKGFAGGADVWRAIDEFFDGLRGRATVAGPAGPAGEEIK